MENLIKTRRDERIANIVMIFLKVYEYFTEIEEKYRNGELDFDTFSKFIDYKPETNGFVERWNPFLELKEEIREVIGYKGENLEIDNYNDYAGIKNFSRGVRRAFHAAAIAREYLKDLEIDEEPAIKNELKKLKQDGKDEDYRKMLNYYKIVREETRRDVHELNERMILIRRYLDMAKNGMIDLIELEKENEILIAKLFLHRDDFEHVYGDGSFESILSSIFGSFENALNFVIGFYKRNGFDDMVEALRKEYRIQS